MKVIWEFFKGEKGIRNSYLLLFVIGGLFQIFFTDYINMESGAGYDGGWYLDFSKNIFSKTDNYHIIRQFPSIAVWTFVKMLKLVHIDIYEVRVFQIFNLLYISITIVFINKISNFYKLNQYKKHFFFLLIFSGFYIIRDSFFNPVMTDICSYMETIVLYYYFISRKFNHKIVFLGLITLFTNPFPLIIISILGIFSKCFPSKIEPRKGLNFSLYASAIMAGIVCLASSIILIHKQSYSYWVYPDEAIPVVVYPTIIFHSILLCYFFYQLLENIDFKKIIPSLVNIRYNFIFLLVSLVTVIKAVQFLYPIKFEFVFASIVLVWTLFINMKPLIGFVDSTSYFGIIIPLAVIWFRPIGRFLFQEFGLGAILISLIGLIFLFKSESRHSLFFIPLLAIGLVNAGPQVSRKFLLICFVVSLFVSKFWYPLSLANFENEQFQDYPAQHYFAFVGPCLAWGPYFLFLLIFLGLLIFFNQLKRSESSQNLDA